MAGGQDKFAMDRAEYNRMRKEIERLKARVAELERAFQHYHTKHPDIGDLCMSCGLDLRDPVHMR